MADREGISSALTYDPGADAARRHPSWVIRHHSLRGIPEVLCPDRKVILVERGHRRAERRCSLAHAVAHIDLDHRAANLGVLTARQENAADRLAARRLVNVRHLATAWLWAESFSEVAYELDVVDHFLALRLKHLHPAERHFMRKQVARKEWAC